MRAASRAPATFLAGGPGGQQASAFRRKQSEKHAQAERGPKRTKRGRFGKVRLVGNAAGGDAAAAFRRMPSKASPCAPKMKASRGVWVWIPRVRGAAAAAAAAAGVALPTYLFLSVQTGTGRLPELPAAPPPPPGSGRQPGWPRWPGTRRVTQMDLQNSSISRAHTLLLALGNALADPAAALAIIPTQKP